MSFSIHWRGMTVRVICALVCGGFLPAAYADSVSDRAAAHMDRGQPLAALRVLETVEAQRAGSAEFDYALAVAALEAGESGKALLVFVRILAERPRFHGARLDYARALLADGQLGEAQAELDRVAAANPPPAAAAAVRETRAQIIAAARASNWSFALGAGLESGFDSNVNSATALREFLGFDLTDASREQDSLWYQWAVDARAIWERGGTWQVVGGLGYRQRTNQDAGFADSDIATGRLAFHQSLTRQRRSVTLQGFSMDVDGEGNNQATSISGDWQYALNSRSWIGVVAGLHRVRYGDELEIKDVDQTSFGVTGRHILSDRAQLVGFLGHINDDPVDSASRYARDRFKATLGADWLPWQNWLLRVRGSVVLSDYDSVFFEQSLDEPREDDYFRLATVLEWRYSEQWRFRARAAWEDNRTNVDVFEYDRFNVGLGAHYRWR